MEMSFKTVLRIVVLISNAYFYCSLVPSHLANDSQLLSFVTDPIELFV